MKQFPKSLEPGMFDFSFIVYQLVDIWQRFIVQLIQLKDNYLTNNKFITRIEAKVALEFTEQFLNCSDLA